MRFTALASLLIATLLFAACSDEDPPSGTTSVLDSTSVPGVQPDLVLLFEDEPYVLSSVLNTQRLTDSEVVEAGTGRVTGDNLDRDITVYRRTDADFGLYTEAPVPQQGGAETEGTLYMWIPDEDAQEISPGDGEPGDDD